MTRTLPRTMSVVVPVKDGGALFGDLCRHLAIVRERYDLEIIVIDSGSTDSTVALAREHGFSVHEIPPAEFGHGRTRNLGLRLATSELVVMITHDVLPCTPDWPEHFAAAFEDPRVAGAYGRQVPRDAWTSEMFFVAHNYPDTPFRFEAGGAMPEPGRVLFSDAFSVLRRDVALRLPYEDEISYCEDLVWAHSALGAGHVIAYVPEAEALHAHQYTYRGLYRRSWYIGQALRQFRLDGRLSFGASVRLLLRVVAYFVTHGHAHRLPQMAAYEFVRWLGFQAGRRAAATVSG